MVSDLTVYDIGGKEVEKITLPEILKPQKKYTHLVAEVIKGYLSNLRAGTACTKTRAEVSGGGRKPWRQKHTGRARAGSIRSPLWRKGGIIFGPKPRSYYLDIPKRMRRLALVASLADRIESGDVRIVTEVKVTAPRTSLAEKILKEQFGEFGSALVIVEKIDQDLKRAFRNLGGKENPARLKDAQSINAYDILWPEKILISQRAFEFLMEKRLKLN